MIATCPRARMAPSAPGTGAAPFPHRPSEHHGCTSTHRHPHRRGRRPRAQLGHQERRLPRDRPRLRGRGDPAGLGGPDPPAPRRGARPGVRADPGPDQHPDHRPDRRHDPPLVAHQPAQDADHGAAGLARPQDRGRQGGLGGRLRPHRPRARDHRAPRPDPPRDDRRRRHAVVLVDAVRARPAAGGDPQDDGQRRQRDRVLHRLLVGDHPGQGGPQPAAHDARLARADRRVPDLRTRRRVHRAVHGVRDLEPVRDPRVPLRHRGAGRDPQGGPRATTPAGTRS